MTRSGRTPPAALVALAAALALPLVLPLGPAQAADHVVRIGYQKYGQLIILKQKGWLEPALAADGERVAWKLFTSGPQLLEALAAGAIDFGVTGDAPPVAAQSAGAALMYVGVEPAMPAGEAIVVPAASAIRTLADLAGKRVALNRASNVHWLLISALRSASIPWSAIRPIYLAPPDGRAAFVSGDVDAWAIWDPFLADAEAQAGARVLHDGTGLTDNRQFFLASTEFVRSSPALLRVVLDTIRRSDAWAASHRADIGPTLAQAIGLPLASVQKAADRLAFGEHALDDDVVADQQRIADAFLALHLIPTAVVVRDAVWHDPKGS